MKSHENTFDDQYVKLNKYKGKEMLARNCWCAHGVVKKKHHPYSTVSGPAEAQKAYQISMSDII